jgi:hypothetical protein
LPRHFSVPGRGRGSGEFPTIESFEYREELAFVMRPNDPTLRYEQRAWRQADGGEEPSHWEVGFISMTNDGKLELLNAQLGRTEVMSGQLSEDDGSLELRLEAEDHSHDSRMRGAARRLQIAGDTMQYEMHMATERVPELTLHLRARLTRDRDVA